MRKDFKTGSLIGMVFVAILMVWVATRETLNIESRILDDDRQAVSVNIPAANSVMPATGDIPTEAAQPIHETMPQEKPPEKRFYTVQKGETLSDISSKFYGTVNKWQKIYDANKDKMKDPAHVRAGTQLIIPD